jgi:hypothetical protein
MSQTMSPLLQGDEALIKRLLRYLRSYPACVNLILFQQTPGRIVMQSDSDWAGDVVSRKSTSGGLIAHGVHLILHWCSAQANIALSSGEAELNSVVKVMSEAIGVFELMRELGLDTSLRHVQTDSSAAKRIILRKGVGKMKHLSTKQLWIQGADKAYGVIVDKIPRNVNSSDLLTQVCTRKDFDDHL